MTAQPTDPRAPFMKALGIAETLVAGTAQPPHMVRLYAHATPSGLAIGVELHISNDPDAVRAYAEAFGGICFDEPGESDGVEYVDTRLRGEVNGVEFTAWTRVYPPAVEQPADQGAEPAARVAA